MLVTRTESLAARLDRDRSLPDEVVLDVVGQVGFALQALHDNGLAHGAVSAERIAFHHDGAITLDPPLSGVAATPATVTADLSALGRLARDAMGPGASPGSRRFLEQLAEPPRDGAPDAGDVARTSLAMMHGTWLDPAATDRPTGSSAVPPPAAGAVPDPGQRRIRNRLIAVGAAAVLIGLVVLRITGGPALETVPAVSGDTYAAAAAVLHAHGLAVREQVTAAQPDRPSGTVVHETPAAGARVRAGTTVILTVAG